MKIQLRAVIEFTKHDDFRIEGGLVFDRFLPSADNATPMSFADAGLTATLIVDPAKHLDKRGEKPSTLGRWTGIADYAAAGSTCYSMQMLNPSWPKRSTNVG